MNQVLSAAPGSAAIIEPATWRDLNSLRRLEQACFPQDAWPLWDLIGVLTFSNVVRLKATRGETMAGFIAADVRRVERVAWIATLGVLPEYRHQGIGMELLNACEERLEVPAIRLSVRASNQPALRLYTRAGYQHYTIWPKYYGDGEDGLVLEKILIKGKGL
jgi:ribosomal protein S18 acetylase RimI-like enzyme